jgi:hypothetical protein
MLSSSTAERAMPEQARQCREDQQGEHNPADALDPQFLGMILPMTLKLELVSR